MPDGAEVVAIVVAIAMCVVGLLALAASTLLPGPGSRAQGRRDRLPVPRLDLESRLRPYGADRTVIDLAGAEQSGSLALAGEPPVVVQLPDATPSQAGAARAKATAASIKPSTTQTLARRGVAGTGTTAKKTTALKKTSGVKKTTTRVTKATPPRDSAR